MARLLLLFLFFSALIYTPALLMQTGRMADLRIPQFTVLYIFFSFITLLVVAAVTFMQQKKHAQTATQTFLAATVIKLLLCMGVALFCLLRFRPDKTLFMINFFYLYFLNTAFEVYALIRNLRHQKF